MSFTRQTTGRIGASLNSAQEIMAGVGGHSTKQVLEFIEDARAAGADYALVLPCAYFGKQTSAKVVRGFYEEVAGRSVLPILIYVRLCPAALTERGSEGRMHC